MLGNEEGCNRVYCKSLQWSRYGLRAFGVSKGGLQVSKTVGSCSFAFILRPTTRCSLCYLPGLPLFPFYQTQFYQMCANDAGDAAVIQHKVCLRHGSAQDSSRTLLHPETEPHLIITTA